MFYSVVEYVYFLMQTRYKTLTRKKSVYDLLENNKEAINNAWKRIDNEVGLISSKSDYKTGIKRIRKDKKRIVKQELSIIYRELGHLGVDKILEISKLFTKSWESTIKHYEELGVSKKELLEDKLSHHLC